MIKPLKIYNFLCGLLWCTLVFASLIFSGGVYAQQKQPLSPDGIFLTDVPEYDFNVILVRPTNTSITLNLLSCKTETVRIRFAAKNTPFLQTGGDISLTAGEPLLHLISGLTPSTQCRYEIIGEDAKLRQEGTFFTARKPNEAFTFAIQADSHLDESTVLERYNKTLKNIAESQPDFLIDLGDTFMTGKHPSRESATKQYLAQRYYFGTICHSVPLFLVLGNHDGEELKTDADLRTGGLPHWSLAQRTKYFANPAPTSLSLEKGAFYCGNTEGLQNFYAWHWGDALFIVLDPYWSSRSTRGGKYPWKMTLGKTQYDWLAETLKNSDAKYKFVFVHQLVGGLDAAGRGGIEAAYLYEWGGKELDGNDTFAKNRPNWERPIHPLLVANKVDYVFHGHDHFFAKQELDGVIYQLVPQPAHRNIRKHFAAEYGYIGGEFKPNGGFLKVTITPENMQVDYIMSR
ncbi:MAG: metallophosphoesterase family protein [Thermoguttaceae bacterium]